MEELKTQTGPDPLGRGLWMEKVADRSNIMGEKAEDAVKSCFGQLELTSTIAGGLVLHLRVTQDLLRG